MAVAVAIGIAHYPYDGKDAATLLRRAVGLCASSQAQGRARDALTQHHPEQMRRSRAHRKPYAELAAAAGGEVRDHPVQSDTGEQERERGEAADQHYVEPLGEQRALDDLGHGAHVVERLVGIDIANCGADRLD